MLNQFDAWLANNGPVALTIREDYIPVGGAGSVFFPPTFAPEEGSNEKPTYVIDNGNCIVDTVGSQANRIEPIFQREPYRTLVPQVTVKIGEDRSVNLLDAGHRAADAVVRFSSLWQSLREAFLVYRNTGQSQKLAKIAPTSLVFGVWDSRDTQAKLPRLISSTIRAKDAQLLRRSAQYFSSIEEEDRAGLGIDTATLGDKEFPSQVGLVDNPSGRAPGGVIAAGGIQREAVLNLVALRSLAGANEEETLALRRYILGLALVAFSAPCELDLRQGCLLCQDPDGKTECKLVERNGTRKDVPELNEASALAYAQAAAAAFGVGENREAVFEPKMVKEALDSKKAKKKGK